MTTFTRLGELTGEYVVDAERSRVRFVARHRLGNRVRGRFAVFEGAVRVDGDEPARSSAWLSIRAESIETGNEGRDAQLRKDFLGVAELPSMCFVSTTVEQVGPTTFDVTGDLTIRGTTESVTVPLEVSRAEGSIEFSGRQTIDRRRWQVYWHAFTTAVVGPDVLLDLQISAVRRR
jgi:polyisoprenoid-binding protein YceI